MKFTGQFNLPRIDLRRWQRELEKDLTEQLVLSATAWLSEAVKAVPVWSGAARATFLDLASLINFRVSISRAATAPNRIQEGASQGSGELNIVPSKGLFEFSYSTTLDHLIFNETNSNAALDPKVFAKLLRPIPYNFIDKSRSAWLTAIKAVRLPLPRVVTTSFRF